MRDVRNAQGCRGSSRIPSPAGQDTGSTGWVGTAGALIPIVAELALSFVTY